MPDILIRMEMPKSCADCPFEVFGDCYGGKVKRIMDVDDYTSARAPRCPLHELPPHGDLIDRAALMEEHAKAESAKYGNLFVAGDNRFIHRFLDAPVIVPAEREG